MDEQNVSKRGMMYNLIYIGINKWNKLYPSDKSSLSLRNEIILALDFKRESCCTDGSSKFKVKFAVRAGCKISSCFQINKDPSVTSGMTCCTIFMFPCVRFC